MEKTVITDVTISFTLEKDRNLGVANREDSGPGGASDGIYRLGNGVSAPIPTYKPEPPYTKKARAAKLQGTVTLWIVIGAEGTVQDVKAVPGFDEGLTENAIKTVKTWKFVPAFRDGQAVPCKVMVQIRFKLF